MEWKKEEERAANLASLEGKIEAKSGSRRTSVWWERFKDSDTYYRYTICQCPHPINENELCLEPIKKNSCPTGLFCLQSACNECPWDQSWGFHGIKGEVTNNSNLITNVTLVGNHYSYDGTYDGIQHCFCSCIIIFLKQWRHPTFSCLRQHKSRRLCEQNSPLESYW